MMAPPAFEIRRALVTGATGFIGRALCGRLRAMGACVRGVARTWAAGPWDEFVALDLARLVPSAILAEVDTVFHLAAKAHAVDEILQDVQAYERINVDATRELIEHAIAHQTRCLVFFSSVKVLGEGASARLDETATPAPETVYGRTKWQAENLVSAAAARGLHGVNLRLPLVYGPGCKGNLPRMLRAVARGRFPPLAESGNRRSMVHVDDVATAAISAATMRAAAGETYIVTDGQVYSTRRIHELMCQALGKPMPAYALPLGALRVLGGVGDVLGRYRGRRLPFDSAAIEKLTGSAWYCSRKLETTLGFLPRWDLAKALPEMVADLRRCA